jgi:hypothetical protein
MMGCHLEEEASLIDERVDIFSKDWLGYHLAFLRSQRSLMVTLMVVCLMTLKNWCKA